MDAPHSHERRDTHQRPDASGAVWRSVRLAGLLSPCPQLVSHSHTRSGISETHLCIVVSLESAPWQLVRRSR